MTAAGGDLEYGVDYRVGSECCDQPVETEEFIDIIGGGTEVVALLYGLTIDADM